MSAMVRAGTAAAIKAHPAFEDLVRLERERARLSRQPGNRSAILANGDACRIAEQAIMRDTGASFPDVATIALHAVGFPPHPGRPNVAALDLAYDGPIPSETLAAAEAADRALHQAWERNCAALLGTERAA